MLRTSKSRIKTVTVLKKDGEGMSAKISAIILFYNGAAYLPEYVTSVLNQTYANLEVILVDDGSTDASSRQAEEFRQRDQRVRVLHKANGGLPVTVAMRGWPWPRGIRGLCQSR